ncbi:hypothetical protein AEAC466_19190 [Asticcacaulis sp. AC466]|nr:hypothetical protein AEAC466_19190 [Asticcacaulis sp. AC466]
MRLQVTSIHFGKKTYSRSPEVLETTESAAAYQLMRILWQRIEGYGAGVAVYCKQPVSLDIWNTEAPEN